MRPPGGRRPKITHPRKDPMMYSPRWKTIAALSAVGVLALAGCADKASSGSAGSTASSSASAGPAGSASGSAPAGSAAGSAPAVSSTPDLTIMVGGMSKQIYLPYMLAKQL